MHDVKNITYSFLFLIDEHGCLVIVGLDDLHAFSEDCGGNPWKIFDGMIETSHITHLVYMAPEEAKEALDKICANLRSGRRLDTVIPAYTQAAGIQANETGEMPPGWYPNQV